MWSLRKPMEESRSLKACLLWDREDRTSSVSSPYTAVSVQIIDLFNSKNRVCSEFILVSLWTYTPLELIIIIRQKIRLKDPIYDVTTRLASKGRREHRKPEKEKDKMFFWFFCEVAFQKVLQYF